MQSWDHLPSADRPWIVAHRGFAAACPENTLPAFEAALAAGADAVELDVQLSRDRVPFVLHDDTLERTTDGHGRPDEHPADALEALDAGSWFAPTFAGTPVPRLETVLTLLEDRLLVNVELKASGYEPEARPDTLEAEVVHLVQKFRLHDQVVVSSFEHRMLERVHTRDPAIRVALLYERLPDPGAVVGAAQRFESVFVAPDADVLDEEEVRELWDAGVALIPWTVNDAPAMRRWARAGVRGLFTDEVEVGVTVLGAR